MLEQELTPFTIGVSMTGNSPGTPLVVDATTSAEVQADVPLFLATSLLEEAETAGQLTYYQDLQYELQQNQITSVVVFQNGIRFVLPDGESVLLEKAVSYNLPTPVSSWELVGFDSQNIAETPRSLVGVTFAQEGDVEISVTRNNPIDVTVDLTAIDSENQGQIDEIVAGQLRPTVSLSADIDGDGFSSPLTDGVLLIRYLRGLRDAALTDNAVNSAGDRTDADDVVRYIEDVLLQSVQDAEDGSVRRPLDIDGDGLIGQSTDAVLLTRYLAGYTGDALISGALGVSATRRTTEEILAYLDAGILTANNEQVALRDESGQTQQSLGVGFATSAIVDRRDRDQYGVDRTSSSRRSRRPGIFRGRRRRSRGGGCCSRLCPIVSTVRSG